ncbi:MAG: GDYXXLXY domain-containing protein [Synergistaceae bacterium]|jgi:uncharacterized membrane-anchored protein|nr:GDYXXLXY domain-containing protein [Synergistaceae bacterium]
MNKPVSALGRTIWKYVAVSLLPLGLLISTPLIHLAVLSLGEAVLLETEPVDPRDIFRGDYVTLNYKISSIPEDLMPEAMTGDETDAYSSRNRTREVYVTLKKDDSGVGSVESVSLSAPASGLYLKSLATRSWNSSFTCDYRLGVYFLPEGTGGEMEEKISHSRVLADVRVLLGRGVIKNLEVAEPLPDVGEETETNVEEAEENGEKNDQDDVEVR